MDDKSSNNGFSADEIFQRTALLLGNDVMKRLQAARVIIFGVGGVGSWCAEALVRTGIGNITIVDNDTVSATNINRQLPATTLTVGEPKTQAMAGHLRAINPHANIVCVDTFYCEENCEEFDFTDYDYVIDAIDSLSPKMLLIERATRQNHARLFSSMGAALKLSAQSVRVAEFAKVKGCPLARALRQRFKRKGTWPRRKFKCVYSEELLTNKGFTDETCSYKAAINGSLVTVTATFGLTLASLVVEDICQKS